MATTYSVKDIAKLLAVDEETVRRWIRTGKLGGTARISNRTANKVTLDALNSFLKESPKYASKVITSPTGLSFLVGGLLGGIVGYLIKKNKSKIDEDDVKELLQKKIDTSQNLINEKHEKISALEQEIKDEEFEIKKYELALSNLDFKMVADQINENL